MNSGNGGERLAEKSARLWPPSQLIIRVVVPDGWPVAFPRMCNVSKWGWSPPSTLPSPEQIGNFNTPPNGFRHGGSGPHGRNAACTYLGVGVKTATSISGDLNHGRRSAATERFACAPNSKDHALARSLIISSHHL